MTSDHLTRFDKMIEESNGESIIQVGIQGVFYLFMVKESVRTYGTEAKTSTSFSDIYFSTLISLLSLASGKFQVQILDDFYYISKSFLCHASKL